MQYQNEKTSVDAAAYTEDYFLTECDGYDTYLESEGKVLARRLDALWSFLHATPGMKVLDLGCGRGEISIYCGLYNITAVGIDYSAQALKLAQAAITEVESTNPTVWVRPRLLFANAQHLPCSDNNFDRVIMSDIVEHLYPRELKAALQEVKRVLKPGGELLIHTMPNLWYYHYGYPVFRLAQRMRGTKLPADPRERIRYAHLHVNEQSPTSLSCALASIGFSTWRVWLYDYRDYQEYEKLMRWIMRQLTHLPLIQKIFCDDIFARAVK